MKLLALEIHSLPGIEPGFRLDDIAGGTNIVIGPNGIGKSSLVRAMRYLVSEDRTDPPGLSLTARFEIGGITWVAQRLGRQLTWTSAENAERPVLPPRDQLHCYWLSMEDLLASEHGDDSFIVEIRRALSGGFDLDALRSVPGLSVGPRIGVIESRQWGEAEKSLREVESDYRSLGRDEQRLPDLERQIEESRVRAGREARLQGSLRLLDLRRRQREVSAALASFPIAVAALKGDEAERLQQLRADTARLRDESTRTDERHATARANLARTGLADGEPPATALQAREDDWQQAKRNAENLDRLKGELRDAQSLEHQACERLGKSPAIPRLTPEHIAEAEALARDLYETSTRLAELRGQIDAGTGNAAASVGELERYRRASEALAGWLAADSQPRSGVRLAAVLGAGGALVAMVLAALASAWLAAGAALVALVAIAWMGWAMAAHGAGEARGRFLTTGLEQPSGWDRVAVQSRRDEIEQHIASFEQARVNARALDKLRGALPVLEKKLATLEEKRREMAAVFGFDPQITGAGLDFFIRVTRDWLEAHARSEQLRLQVAEGQASLGQSLGELAGFLVRWGVAMEDPGSLHEIKVGQDELAARARSAAQARHMLEDARAERDRLQHELAARQAAEQQLFTACGIETGDAVELERLVRLRQEWLEKSEQRRDLESRERQLLEGEEPDAQIVQWTEAGDREAIELELARSGEARAQLERLQGEQTRILTRLQDAGHDLRLERALAEADQARAALQASHRDTLRASVAQGLIDSIEREFRIEQEPDVLRAARQRFASFTHHAWSLQVGENRFQARELSRGAVHELGELSSGTRMQLLLAVRLAWISHLERHSEGLPLILDEALTSSDEGRFRSVVNSLEQLVHGEHRQVFYLCARHNEIDLWQHVSGHRPHLIELEKIRFGRQAVETPVFQMPEPPGVPPPDGDDAVQYAQKLGVPGIDVRASAGAMHLFHILHDQLGLLYQLMKTWRLHRLGPFEAWLASDAARRLISDGRQRRRLLARCRAAHAWLDNCRQGRWVDRRALAESQAVSGTFLEPVLTLAESLGGDGGRLIQHLRAGEVGKFQTRKINELDKWLIGNGYIDTRQPLTADQRLRETLASADDDADPEDIAALVDWLEQGASAHRPLAAAARTGEAAATP